jgi:polyisoprenoid-binding protein YceI
MRMPLVALPAALLALHAGAALAKPVNYVCDPNHTHPSFWADHFGGLSIWRGEFTRTTCRIVLDRQQRTGTVKVTIDTGSADFGERQLNADIKAPQLLDVARYPTATYRGRLAGFRGGAPTRVIGTFTFRGITHPLDLRIVHFECKEVPMMHQYRCGADARGEFNRARYGMSFGKQMGFRMWVKLFIQVEAVRQG